MNGNEKKAMDPENKKMLSKYLKAGVVSALLAAGIGATVRRNRAKKEREKANDAYKNKNAIVIPVRKDKFLEGLPTPDELAASRGENVQAEEPKGLVGEEVAQTLTPEEIAAKKKEILRRGTKFNFFGTKSAEKKDEGGEGKKTEQESEAASAPDVKVEKKESKEVKINPRNELGQFVSQTDPTGVVKTEKDAGFEWKESFKNLFFHPFNTMGGAWESATTRPVYIAAGGIGSVLLASMIVDKINEIRSSKAKSDAESAREKYVKILQGNEEKTAAEDGYRDTENPISAAGTLLGGSFIIPAAISAMIAYKIMERRKEDKKKKKEMSDSYPDEPIVLYKTSSDKEVKISPETALALISVKRDMLKCAEEYERQMEKSAQQSKGLSDVMTNVWNGIQNAAAYAKYQPILDIVNDNWDPKTNTLSDEGYKKLALPENDELVYGLSRMMTTPGKNITFPDQYKDLGNRINVMRGDARTEDLLQNKFSNSDANGYDKRWGKWQNEKIDKDLGDYFGNNGVGGFFKNIIAWLAKVTGIGGWFVRRGIHDMLGKANTSQLQTNQQKAQTQNLQTQPNGVPQNPNGTNVQGANPSNPNYSVPAGKDGVKSNVSPTTSIPVSPVKPIGGGEGQKVKGLNFNEQMKKIREIRSRLRRPVAYISGKKSESPVAWFR